MSAASLVRLCLLACIWGSSFLFIELALEGLAPAQIVFGRLVGAAVTLTVVARLGGHRLPRQPRVWAHLGLMGLAANIVAFFLMSWGQQHVSSGVAGVLNGATPLFTLAFAVGALPDERLSPQRAYGLLLGFAGVVLVVGPWEGDGTAGSLAGQVACVAAAATYGAVFVYTRRFITNREASPVALAAGQMQVAALLFALAAPFFADEPVALTPVVVVSIVELGVLGTGIAYLLYYRLITDAGATSTSMVNYLAPLVAVALGVVALGEPLGWNVFAGAAVVVTGVALAEGRLPVGRRLARRPS
jgi:drug/metabolite transporter (DMT)-like permease